MWPLATATTTTLQHCSLEVKACWITSLRNIKLPKALPCVCTKISACATVWTCSLMVALDAWNVLSRCMPVRAHPRARHLLRRLDTGILRSFNACCLQNVLPNRVRRLYVMGVDQPLCQRSAIGPCNLAPMQQLLADLQDVMFGKSVIICFWM